MTASFEVETLEGTMKGKAGDWGDNMDIVKLKNGSEEEMKMVAVMMMNLNRLLDDDPRRFYDLVMLCRDSEYQIFGDGKAVLQGLSLVQPNGRVHQSIQNVVLSAVSGEGFDLTLGSPVAE